MEEIIDVEQGFRCVIPARLDCLVVGQPFDRLRAGSFQPVPLKRVTNTEYVAPNYLHCALETQDFGGQLISIEQPEVLTKLAALR